MVSNLMTIVRWEFNSLSNSVFGFVLSIIVSQDNRGFPE